MSDFLYNNWLYIWTSLFGLVMGSFLNVVAFRDKARATLFNDRSRCPHCHKQLRWFELIPLFSFAIQLGKCRRCHKSISWRYPIVELSTAGLYILALWFGYYQHTSIILAITYAIVLSLFLIVSLTDWQDMTVDVRYCIAAFVIGLTGKLLSVHYTYLRTDYLIESIWGLAFGAGIILVVSALWRIVRGQMGMGEGDIFILGAMGAIIGYPLVIVNFVSAVFFGALLGVIVLIKAGKNSKNARLPFGPFLFVGFIVAMIFGESILRWYLVI